MELVDDTLHLDFPYDELEVQALLRIAGARWSKLSKRWVVPITSLDAVRAFAAKYRLSMSPDVVRFSLPPRHSEGMILHDGVIYLWFRPDYFRMRACKDIAGLAFEGKRGWTLPPSSIVDAVKFCEQFQIEVQPVLWETARYFKLRNGPHPRW